MLGEFEIYVRSLGFKGHRDHHDRNFLFKKSLRGGRFPEKEEIIDQLICLSIMYGDSKKMAID